MHRDASLDLAHQLIAAKINVMIGLPASSAVLACISTADSLLCMFSGKLPYHVPQTSPKGQQMVATAKCLEAYNTSCHTGGGK